MREKEKNMLTDYEKNTPSLETQRLMLRPMTEKDVPDLEKWLGLDVVYTYWGRKATRGEKNPGELFVDPRPWVKRKPSPDFKWGMVLKEKNEVMGEIAVFDIQNGRMGDVAYRLNPAYWGRGYATEALQEVVRFIFTQTAIQRLNGGADVRNVASCRVMEKCGFVREGTVRQGKMVSVYCDYHIYGLLREDYEK